jgi:hypothetical protein
LKDDLNIGIIDNQNNEKTNGSKYFNQKRESVVSNIESESKKEPALITNI